MNKIIVLFVLGIASISSLIATDEYINRFDTSAPESNSIMPTAMAANPYSCMMTSEAATERAGFSFKVPRSIPSTHEIGDAFGEKGEIALYYAPGPICGNNTKYRTFEDGIILYVNANMDSTMANRIIEGESYFKEHKANAPIPDKIHLFDINGMSAMGWESGIRKSLVIDHDGKIIHEEDIPHPAEIRIVDPVNQEFYILKGNLPLDQMKDIMRSTLS
ncbi:MAG: hypothetical protein WD018_04610 [Nitrosopumilaceae archaeon]